MQKGHILALKDPNKFWLFAPSSKNSKGKQSHLSLPSCISPPGVAKADSNQDESKSRIGEAGHQLGLAFLAPNGGEAEAGSQGQHLTAFGG